VIAVDTNLLVYAHRADSEWHERANQVVTDLTEGTAAWAIPWPCLHEFFAIVTHPRIYNPPSPVRAALAQIRAWLESPTLALLSEGDGYFDVLERLLQRGAVVGAAVHDARVTALCVRSGVKQLLSADRDFSRFPELRTTNPLIR
jgi:toxin-antitoxin system PIN domain toxin